MEFQFEVYGGGFGSLQKAICHAELWFECPVEKSATTPNQRPS